MRRICRAATWCISPALPIRPRGRHFPAERPLILAHCWKIIHIFTEKEYESEPPVYILMFMYPMRATIRRHFPPWLLLQPRGAPSRNTKLLSVLIHSDRLFRGTYSAMASFAFISGTSKYLPMHKAAVRFVKLKSPIICVRVFVPDSD